MIDLLKDDISNLLVLEKLSESNLNNSFSVESKYSEYKDFLYNDAFLYQAMLISKTYLLIEKETRNIVAYVSLAADTVALKPQEKKKTGLQDIPFLFLPALKITKLADIEHNPNVVEFYQKNGFSPLKSNIYKRKFPTRTKIIGMWRNII